MRSKGKRLNEAIKATRKRASVRREECQESIFRHWVGARIDRLHDQHTLMREELPRAGGLLATSEGAPLITVMGLTLLKHFRRGRPLAAQAEARRMADEAMGKLAEGGDRPIACRKGCFSCCTQPVTALVPEIVEIAGRLKTTLDERETAQLRARIEKYRRRVNSAEPGRSRPLALCPLNVDGECSVYDIRPLLCRGYNSYDAAACERAAEEGFEGPTAIPIDLSTYMIAAAANLSLRLSATYEGRELEPRDLVEALGEMLARP